MVTTPLREAADQLPHAVSPIRPECHLKSQEKYEACPGTFFRSRDRKWTRPGQWRGGMKPKRAALPAG